MNNKITQYNIKNIIIHSKIKNLIINSELKTFLHRLFSFASSEFHNHFQGDLTNLHYNLTLYDILTLQSYTLRFNVKILT